MMDDKPAPTTGPSASNHGAPVSPARPEPPGRGATDLSFRSPDSPGMPGCSGKSAWDFMPPGWSEREGRWSPPRGFEPTTQLDFARLGVVTEAMKRVAEREPHLSAEQVRREVAAGRMIIPANRNHLAHRLDPIGIGRGTRTKINANIGTSPVSSDTAEELEKLAWAVRWGADTVMDLSTGGDVDGCRRAIVQAATVPIGTVPLYSMIIDRPVEELTIEHILEGIEHQAAQGVDYFTVHAGLLRDAVPLATRRLTGIVSRGGSLLASWMVAHEAENPMYTAFDAICEILRRHDVAFSLGDGLRPGCLADATDEAQLSELRTIARLTERAWQKGCQVMVEGPGHVPYDQIEYNMKLQRSLCHGAPFYVLGPIVSDVFAGYDHITSAIGSTAAAYHGAAMLCYVTPKEHLGLPRREDVKAGCIAHKIAAHAADVALGIPQCREGDDAIAAARAGLDWPKQFELAFDPEVAKALHDEDMSEADDYCAMCGHDWCAVRRSADVRRKLAEKEAARGTREGAPLPVGGGKSAGAGAQPRCHSERTDADAARRIRRQAEANRS